MSEGTTEAEYGPEAIGARAEPAAVSLALAGASREEADGFLRDQRSLIDVQKHHLLKQFSLGLWEKRLGVLLRLATVLVGMTLAAGFSLLIWDAIHAEGLLIEPFSVPPDMAERGVTGQAVAAEVSDRISELNGQISSQRAPKTFVNDWSARDIKVEIPDTGISFSELEQFLRSKLGGDVHVSGEVIRNAGTLKLTARVSGAGASAVTGPESDLDLLIQTLAEKVFRLTQPYRYGVYLSSHGREPEALAVAEDLAGHGPSEDNPWALNLVAQLSQDLVSRDAALAEFRHAVQVDPENELAVSNYARMETELGMAEASVRDWKIQQTLMAGKAKEMVRASVVPSLIAEGRSYIAASYGDFRPAMADSAMIISSKFPGHNTLSPDLARNQLGEHEISAARTTMADPVSAAVLQGTGEMSNIAARMMIDLAARDWQGALREGEKADAVTVTYPGMKSFIPAMLTPLAAVAEAELHRFEHANHAITATPLDCYHCLIARAHIAQLQEDPAGADSWFARAVTDAPSIPFAEQEWGQALLMRGRLDAAIEKFKLSNQKGPHFADPIEMWGEALMAKNQSHLALEKFAEAEKYAPNWGRLHLKWGEALVYAGRKDEAAKHFARAAALDLTPSEKSELASIHV